MTLNTIRDGTNTHTLILKLSRFMNMKTIKNLMKKPKMLEINIFSRQLEAF